jgi:lipopolysaccharide export system protein LptA
MNTSRSPGCWMGLLFLSTLFLLTSHSSEARLAQKPSNLATDKLVKSESPLYIASDRMEVKYEEGVILFEGHVIVKQDNGTIIGNRMNVYIDKTPKKDRKKKSESEPAQENMAERIDRIEIEGDVKITQDDKIATAERSVYYHTEQKIVLMGHPSVSQGKDVVKGRLITLYLSEGRSVVEGGEDGPVEAVLHPRNKE